MSSDIKRYCLDRPPITTLKISVPMTPIPRKISALIYQFAFIPPHNNVKMNSRTLLRQSSRALSSSLRSAATRRPLQLQFHNNIPLTAQVASRQFQARRFYATEPEAKKDVSEAEKDEPEAEKKEAEVEDPSKKALEAKDKEIIDLKVCASPLPASFACLLLPFVRCDECCVADYNEIQACEAQPLAKRLHII